MKRLIFTLVVICSFPSLAAAEDAAVAAGTGPTIGLGARVGGYGFRDIEGDKLSWADCRMNGTGLFGTLDVGRYFFGEVSADLYHATGSSPGMDRMSFFPAAAVGARMPITRLVTPYVQAGGGPEITHIAINGHSANKLLATGFMGLGGELNIKRLHLGTNIRVFAMGLPEHVHGVTAAHLEPADVTVTDAPDSEVASGEDISIRYEVAAQMQFFLRYTF